MRAGKRKSKGRYRELAVFLAAVLVCSSGIASDIWGETAGSGSAGTESGAAGEVNGGVGAGDAGESGSGAGAAGDAGASGSGVGAGDAGESGSGAGTGNAGEPRSGAGAGNAGEPRSGVGAGNVGESGNGAGVAGDAGESGNGAETGNAGDSGNGAGAAGDAGDSGSGAGAGNAGEPGSGAGSGNAGDSGSGAGAGDAGEPGSGAGSGNAGDSGSGAGAGNVGDSGSGNPGELDSNGSHIDKDPAEDIPPAESQPDTGKPEEEIPGSDALPQPDLLPGPQPLPEATPSDATLSDATPSDAALPAVLMLPAVDEEPEEIEDGDQLIDWLEKHKISGGNAVLLDDVTISSDYVYSLAHWGDREEVFVDTCEYSITIDASVDFSYFDNLTICGQGMPESVIKITPDGSLFLAGNTLYAYDINQQACVIEQQPGSTLAVDTYFAPDIQGDIRSSGFMTGELYDYGFPMYTAVPLGIGEDELELPQTAGVRVFSNDGTNLAGVEMQLPVIWDTSPLTEQDGENKRVCLIGTVDTSQYPGLVIEDTVEYWLCYKTNDAIFLNAQLRQGLNKLTCFFYTEYDFESVALMWSEDGENWNEESARSLWTLNNKFDLSHYIEPGREYYICAKLINGEEISYSNVVRTDGARILEAPDLDGGRGGGTDIIGGGLPSVNQPSGGGADAPDGGGADTSDGGGADTSDGGDADTSDEGGADTSDGNEGNISQEPTDDFGNGQEMERGIIIDETVQPSSESPVLTPDNVGEDGRRKQEREKEKAAAMASDRAESTEEAEYTRSAEDGKYAEAAKSAEAAETALSAQSAGDAAHAESAGASVHAAITANPRASTAAKSAAGEAAASKGSGNSAAEVQIAVGTAASAGLIMASAWAGPDRILRGLRWLLRRRWR